MTERIREFLRNRQDDGPCLVVDLDTRRQRGDELAEVDVPHRGGGVGEELAGAALPLADDRRRADGRRDRERHDDRHRGEEVDGEGVAGPRRRRHAGGTARA